MNETPMSVEVAEMKPHRWNAPSAGFELSRENSLRFRAQ
jgi:hypothetical protein